MNVYVLAVGRCSLKITLMMPNTVAICMDLVLHISRTAAGPIATKVIHQLLPMVMFRRRRRHQPQHRANSMWQTASYRGTGCRDTFVKFGDTRILWANVAETSLRNWFYVVWQLKSWKMLAVGWLFVSVEDASDFCIVVLSCFKS